MGEIFGSDRSVQAGSMNRMRAAASVSLPAQLLGGFRKVDQMRNVFGSLEPFAYALFRIVFGLLFLQFGAQKLFEWPSAPVGYTPTALMKTAACIELACGFLILVGLVADLAAFLASGEMAFAYFLGHFPIAFWPVVSRGVPAVLFCFAFFFIAARGAGIWSLDSLWRKPAGLKRQS